MICDVFSRFAFGFINASVMKYDIVLLTLHVVVMKRKDIINGVVQGQKKTAALAGSH